MLWRASARPCGAGSWWPLIVLPLSVLATHRLVIVPEEVYLGERYGSCQVK